LRKDGLGFDPDEIERNLESAAWRKTVITDDLFRIAAATPDREAVVDARGRATYGQLAAQVRRLARACSDLGVRAGDRVSIQLPNWRECLVAHFALERIGAVAVTLPPMYRHKEMRFILGVTEARVAIVATGYHGFDFLQMYCELWPQLPALQNILTVQGEPSQVPPNPRIRSWTQLIESADGAPPDFTPDPDTLTEIAFTSGSTGDPKGVMHTSNTLLAQDLSEIHIGRLTADDVLFVPSTIGHQLGYSMGVRIPIVLGAKVVFMDHWNPTTAAEIIAKERCSFIMSTPTFLTDLVECPAVETHEGLPSLQRWVLAGAVVPTALMEQARAKMPQLQLGFLFGMTEVGGMIGNQPGGPPQKAAAVGLPHSSAEIRIFGSEGEVVAAGRDGELAIRSPSLFIGYYQRRDLYDPCFTPDGFFMTGDQVQMDSDGYVWVTGRIKDLIKRGGVNLSPVEIEEILHRHPGVVEVAVIGLPDERLGERVCAVVVPRAGHTPTIAEFANLVISAGAAKQKCPERVEILSELPKTPVGKVHKGLLRKMFSSP
jgi:cyclohexanecarboxylate-CoA ligase